MASYMLVIAVVCSALVTSFAFEGCIVRYGLRACEEVMLEGVLVTCDGLDREQDIPVNVPQDAVYLSLNNFRLDTLRKSDFEAFASVQCLTIENSGINKIEADAFSTMLGLKELTIDGSNIDSASLQFINQDTFNVQVLKVTNAPNIHEIRLAPTKNLNEVKTLSFAGNSISAFDFEVFDELKSLASLDLSRNKLETLDWSAFRQIDTLNQLFLDNNRLNHRPHHFY